MEEALSSTLLGKPVIPGEVFSVPCDSVDVNVPVVHGPGLKFLSRVDNVEQKEESVGLCLFQIQNAGVLSHSAREESVFFVKSITSFQYEPSIGDMVVGLVVSRTVDYYRVAIKSRELAYLGQLSFEGATKRNRPEVRLGDIVFARVTSVSPGTSGRQAELVCVAAETDKAEGMGVLRDLPHSSQAQAGNGCAGLVFSLNSSQAIARIVSKNNKYIREIGKRIPFEGAYGYNGIVWVKARSVRETILVANLLQAVASGFCRTGDRSSLSHLIDSALNKISGLL